MLRDLAYQARLIGLFDTYLTHLISAKKGADGAKKLKDENPDVDIVIPDHAERAWQAMKEEGALPPSRSEIPFSPRFDPTGRSVPNVVFKVPTGGGKTYLAISALSKLFGRYLGKNTGFVLWIVPNEAIYSQTLKQLRDRDHPYRQMLDRSAAGSVKILEKGDPLHGRDVDTNLCVMLLMLQSANKQTKESLKMFQDRGDVYGFFPPEGDQAAHSGALKETPNLDAYSTSTGVGSMWPLVKDSLGNALRLIRPVVVLDEGHKAVSELAFKTLYGFNPSFVLELTATPKDVPARTGAKPRPARFANILVEVLGTELDREGMIKMPLNLAALQDANWRVTLNTALERLNVLRDEALENQANGGHYIRPIMLVQVERTGSDQRDGQLIHALDVKEWLGEKGLDLEDEVAIKTAETNDLKSVENQDLLSPSNRVRVIITKQALQEGWDCSFAYVLCSLAASSSEGAMTQLVGRILRQPYATKTGNSVLDECYVYTHHAVTAEVVDAVKQGLKEGGLGDLVKEVRIQDESASTIRGPRPVPRREAFRDHEIYLPLVLRVFEDSVRPLDYETDVIYRLDWTKLDVAPFVESVPESAQAAESQMQRISLTDDDERIISEKIGTAAEAGPLSAAHLTRLVSDIVPNAWIARETVGQVVDGLKQRGFSDELLGSLSRFIVEELIRWLATQRNEMAERLFRDSVADGAIQFRLRADGNNWRMPHESQTRQPIGAPQLPASDGGLLKASLFAPQYEGDFNSDERQLAVYLDADSAIHWWHRNVARSQYSLQGWRRHRIYPDFIFATKVDGRPNRVVVLETKGDHLAANVDSAYKEALLQLVSEAFEWDDTIPAGRLELVESDGTSVHCELVLMSEWPTKLPNLLTGA